MKCNACSKQFFCKLVNSYSDTSQCKDFKRIRDVEVRRIDDNKEDTNSYNKRQKKILHS